MPAHHKAAELLDEYLEAAGIAGVRGTPLFRAVQAVREAFTERRRERRSFATGPATKWRPTRSSGYMYSRRRFPVPIRTARASGTRRWSASATVAMEGHQPMEGWTCGSGGVSSGILSAIIPTLDVVHSLPSGCTSA